MVRAILAGTKTQTRRVFNLPTRCSWYDELGGEEKGWFTDAKYPGGWWHVEELGNGPACPWGVPGDRLWVKHPVRVTGRSDSGFRRERLEDAAQGLRLLLG